MKPNRALALLLAILTALALFTGSVALPILCRPFYHAHIAPMELSRRSGLTAEEIKTAYGEMMDYCTGLQQDFSVGVLPFSEEGASHFADVRFLFLLDLWAFALSALGLLICFLLRKRLRPAKLGRHTFPFWAGTGLAVLFALIGGLAALDFDAAFTVFHRIFFPGKDNWLFNPLTDPIITLLPQDFFMHCALLILALLLGGCALLILWDIHYSRTKGGR